MKHTKTLFNEFCEILSQPTLWCYYDSSDTYKIEDIFKSDSQSKDFIIKYLNLGGKNLVMNQIVNSQYRATHVVSTFFLGILLRSLFNCNFHQKDISLYLWFMTCLFHDIGYEIENSNCKIKCINDFVKEYKIQHNLLEYISKYKLRGISISTIKKYFTYRCHKYNKIDHGIAGGMLLFDRLIKVYKEFEDLCYDKHVRKHFKDGSFEYDNILFSKNHWILYARCAYAIVQHNIWFASKTDDIKTYKEYDLGKLILKDELKYKYQSKMAGLLVLCDTIEPTKFYEKMLMPLCVLNIFTVNCCKEENCICIQNTNECIEITSYLKKCKSLEDWTYLSLSKNNESFTINYVRDIYCHN